jgi:DNA invertase Pin-like site-specific DNA recombinase
MGQGKRIGYIRVSTVDQNPERQLEGIELDKKFTDYASGNTIKRPQLDLMLEYAREDDLIIVHSMDRLARNVKDLRKTIDDLVDKGIKIQFMKENLTFTGKDSPMANLMLMLIGSIAEFELSLIRERQLEGIAIAKKAGKFKGSKHKLDSQKIELLKKRMESRDTKSKIASEFGISRFTLYRYLERIQNSKILEI